MAINDGPTDVVSDIADELDTSDPEQVVQEDATDLKADNDIETNVEPDVEEDNSPDMQAEQDNSPDMQAPEGSLASNDMLEPIEGMVNNGLDTENITDSAIETVDKPVDMVNEVGSEAAMEDVDIVTDEISEEAPEAANLAADDIETLGKVADAPLASVDQGLESSADQAEQSAKEIRDSGNLTPFNEGLAEGKESYANDARILASAGEQVEKGIGKTTGYTSSAVRGMGEMAGDAAENVKEVAGESEEVASGFTKLEEHTAETAVDTINPLDKENADNDNVNDEESIPGPAKP